MKKPYMRIILGSSGSDCVLVILFELYGFQVGLFQGNLFWLGQYDLTLILEEKLIQY